MTRKTDAIIAGGGLAGLGLAYQLKKRIPDFDITVVERRKFPRPNAIAKVGESTVEIGSRYLSHDLDLTDHIRQEHLKKFGIRMFFGESASDFSQQDELGASQAFGIPTYQIDRGNIENHLAQRVKSMGVTLVDEAEVSKLSVGDKIHSMQVKTPTSEVQYDTKWLLDASGRHALVKHTLDLAIDNHHRANAIWFRIDRRIEIDDWSSCSEWKKRCQPQGRRWLSTNHLAGPGYWVWIIPLASGVTSIGIVMDDQAFDESDISCRDSALRWLDRHQKRCADAIDGADFLDFVILRGYSYGCKQTFSDEQWAITGEAGCFTDPLYSPGTDFIAISNNFICDLLASSAAKDDTRFKRALFEKLYFSIYDNTLSLYSHQYGGFGDRRMMGLKLLWDYCYYWGVLSLLYFRGALTNISHMRNLSPLLQKVQLLNQEVQTTFRLRAVTRKILPNRGIFMDQYQIPCLKHFNALLMHNSSHPVESELRENSAILEQVAVWIQEMLKDSATLKICNAEKEILGDYRKLILA